MKQLEEKAETQGQCSKEAAETETILKVCLQGAVPQGARLAMAAAHCDSVKMGALIPIQW